MVFYPFLSFLLIAFTNPVQTLDSKAFSSSDFNQKVNQVMEDFRVPGVAIGLVEKDQVIFARHAKKMLSRVEAAIEKYPTSFSRWARALLQRSESFHELAVVGPKALEMAKAINQRFVPNKIMMASVLENDSYPLLAGRKADGGTNIFVCKEYSCQLPVKKLEEVMELIIPRHN